MSTELGRAGSLVAALALLAAPGCLKQGELSTETELAFTRAALATELEPEADLILVEEPDDIEPALDEPPPEPEPLAVIAEEVSAAELELERPIPELLEPPVTTELVPLVQAAGSGDAIRLSYAIDALTRSIDEQRLMQTVEYRLEDKQRLIDSLKDRVDGLDTPMAPAPIAPVAAPVPPTHRPDEVQQALDAERSARAALESRLAALEETRAPEVPDEVPGAPEGPTETEAGIVALLEAQQELLRTLVERPPPAPPTVTEEPQAASASPTPAPDPELERLQQQVELQRRQLELLMERPQSTDAPAAAAAPQLDPEMIRLQAQMEAQQRQLELLMERPQSTAAPTPAAAPQADPDVIRLQAQMEAQQRQLELLLAQGSSRSEPAPSPATSQADVELQRRLDALIALQEAQQQQAAGPDPALTAEIEQMRARVAELEARPDAGDELRARVEQAERDQIRMEAMETQLQELEAQRTALEQEAASADEARQAELDAERAAHEARSSQLEAELEAMRIHSEEMARKYVDHNEALLAQLTPLEDQGITVRAVAGKIRAELPSDVLFASGSANLSRRGRDQVRDVGRALLPFQHLEVQVEGHTDSVPLRSFKYESNYDLAFARAKVVMEVLVEAGLPARRVSAASFGDTLPIESNDTREGRAANRRIELSLQMQPPRN